MGTLQGMEGVQDLSVGVKYNFFHKKFEKSAFNTFAVLNFSTPLSDYTPDFCSAVYWYPNHQSYISSYRLF